MSVDFSEGPLLGRRYVIGEQGHDSLRIMSREWTSTAQRAVKIKHESRSAGAPKGDCFDQGATSKISSRGFRRFRGFRVSSKYRNV